MNMALVSFANWAITDRETALTELRKSKQSSP
jgi:hypothetical protein